MMMDMWGYGHGWGFGGGMWILNILFWLLIIGGAIFIVKGITTQKGGSALPPADDSPLTILQKRYARGEIDEETFKRMKQELEKSG